MGTPLSRTIGGIFLPVTNVSKARDWYCQVFELDEKPTIEFGHLCVIPMGGNDLILDEMPMWGRDNPGGAPKYQTPAFMFLTENIKQSREWMKELGAEMVTEIMNDQWFAFKDPDGNLLMVCTG